MYICLCPEWLLKVMLGFVLLSVNRWIFILHFQLAWLRSNRAQKNVHRKLFTTFFLNHGTTDLCPNSPWPESG